MNNCPFCKSERTQPMKTTYNDGDRCWRYCTDCGASGPHKDTPEAADAAFVVVPDTKKRGVIARVLGSKQS